MSTLLLKGGIALIHGHNDKIHATHADILIDGNRIVQTGPSITAPSGCNVIDCTDKIISPGFVDTHHHHWETPLKGLFGDSTFLRYISMVATAPFTFHAGDMYWANLAGALEALDAGTTTTLDHAHCNFTKDHSKQAIAGSISSGIRSIFAYTPTKTMVAAKPKPEFSELMPHWFMPIFEKLVGSKTLNEANARVRLGLGFDSYFSLPKEAVVDLFNRAKSLGVKVVTSHYIRHRGEESPRLPPLLKEYGLLEKGVVLSHGGGATVDDAKLMQEAGAHISVTPNIEVSMALGPPVAFRDDLPGMDSICSFGTGSQSVTSPSLVNEMHLALQHARGLNSAANIHQGHLPAEIHHNTHEAFNMGTINGARALGMECDIGSIEIGKRADLIVLSATSPSMLGAAQQDPVMAVVMHSSQGDVEDVIVDGVVRKRDGKLLPVETVEWDEGEGDFRETGKQVGWSEVASRVLDIQQRFLVKRSKHDLAQLEETMAAMMHLQ